MKTEPANPIRIYLAGEYHPAVAACQEFCDTVGLCVTITPTTYVYTGGREAGVIVGLESYPRFPSTPSALRDTAIRLALHLRSALNQRNVMVVTPTESVWLPEEMNQSNMIPVDNISDHP